MFPKIMLPCGVNFCFSIRKLMRNDQSVYIYLLFMYCIDGNVEEVSHSGLESWGIALIVAIPIVALVVMLSIGIMCALRRKSFPKDPGLPPIDNNAATYRRNQEEQQQTQLLYNQ